MEVLAVRATGVVQVIVDARSQIEDGDSQPSSHKDGHDGFEVVDSEWFRDSFWARLVVGVAGGILELEHEK